MLTVIALGGNALLKKGEKGAPSEQWNNVKIAARHIAKILVKDQTNLVITHGNGPQVGYLLEAFDALSKNRPMQSLDLAVAMTQGWIGFMIQNALHLELSKHRLNRKITTIITRVKVDRNDPAFSNPTKFVGRYYTEEEAKKLAKEKGWIMRKDPRGGWRRVVPSPNPVTVLEKDVIKTLALSGAIPIAVGGGGIPVDERLTPVEAVIDKDLASSLLAREIGADKLIILTDVPGIALDYGKPSQKWIHEISVDELERLYKEGIFPAGSMGPKVKAVIEFVKNTGNPAAIGALEEALDVYMMRKGTIIKP